MTRRRREFERALDDLDADDAPDLGEVVVSYEQPDDWEPDPDAVVVDFRDVDT